MRNNKSIGFLFLIILISGCVTLEPRERSVSVTGMDFRPFTEQGFLMTPEKYIGEYDPVGLITVTVWPEVVRESDRKKDTPYSKWISPTGSRSQMRYIEVIPIGAGLQEAYEAAIGMGADGLVNVTTRTVDRAYGPVLIAGIEVNGFAIKRQ